MHIFKNKLLLLLLWPLILVYSTIIWLRNVAYNAGIFKTFNIDAKVISVGNISAGGTGKTPATVFLAEKLQEKGFKVAILARGYGRTSKGSKLVSEGSGPLCNVHEAGDEPYLMAQKTKGIPIFVDENRVNGAEILVQKFTPDVILLDDGFQHRRLARNFDIVLIDAESSLKNQLLLPAVPNRESLHSLKRANLVYMVCGVNSKQQYIESQVSTLKKFTSANIFQCTKEATGLIEAVMKTRYPNSALMNKKIFALAGIGNPQNFVDQLISLGAHIEGFHKKSDHYKYDQNLIQKLLLEFENSNAELFVTTEKDWVKLKDFPILNKTPIRLFEITFSAPETSIDIIIECLRQ
ncbi:MAG: tetraacyldisaccharide 4'-kinase [bacterium]